MSEVACPHCGKANAEAYNNCPVCGTESPSRRLAEEANARHASDKKSVERTKTGTTLVVVAVLLNWVPCIDYLGLLPGTIVKNPSEAQYLTNRISGLSSLHLLWVIPAVLAAIGYLTVIRRIDKGGIPKGAALVNAPQAK